MGNDKNKGDLRRARILAVVLGACLVTTLVSVVYALVQKTEAERQEALAYEYAKRSEQSAEKQREMIIKCEDELNVQKIKYDVVNNQLQIALKDASVQKRKVEENYKKAKK
jgi:hypothetical protein